MNSIFTLSNLFFSRQHFNVPLFKRTARLLPVLLIMAGNAHGYTEQWHACASQVEDSCRDSSGLGEKYQGITYDWPESACMDIETVSRCGHPPIVVTATPIDDHAPPPINPPAGDVLGLEPGSGGNNGLTPKQEQATKLALCKSNSNDELYTCKRNASYNREKERDKCVFANGVEHTMVRLAGRVIRIIPGRVARGLLQGYEDYAPYVGQNCSTEFTDNLRSDEQACEHKKGRDDIICEAVYGN